MPTKHGSPLNRQMGRGNDRERIRTILPAFEGYQREGSDDDTAPFLQIQISFLLRVAAAL